MLTVFTRICYFLSVIGITAKYYVLPIQLTFFITIVVFLVILGKMTSKQQHLHSFGYAEKQDANIEITKLEMRPLVKLPVLGEVAGFILNLMEKVDKFLSKNKRLFDIFCEDKNPKEGLETKYVVPMKQEDWDYLK